KSQTVQLVVAPPPVTITSISPATPAEGANQVVTVKGTGFETGLTVIMGLPGSGSTTISGSQIQTVTATSFQMTVTFSTTGTYTIRISNPDGGGSGIFEFTVGAPSTGPVISPGGVVSNPTGLPGIGPNLYVNINGTNLSSTTDVWDSHITNNTLPTQLDGVTVTIGGELAYLQYVSPTRIQVLTPTDLGLGTVAVQVTNSNGTSAAVSVTSQQFAPGFFEWLNNQPVATHTNFTDAMTNGTYAGLTTVPAAPGEYIILWGSGFGPTTPATPNGTVVPNNGTTYFVATAPSLTINGQPMAYYATALAPGFVGLYQVVAQVPASMPNGDWPVIATVNGVSSPTGILLTVHN
ncbi:MAG: IPT/TIG domain-containing protein, partial [Bryobacteraceae bacterium]